LKEKTMAMLDALVKWVIQNDYKEIAEHKYLNFTGDLQAIENIDNDSIDVSINNFKQPTSEKIQTTNSTPINELLLTMTVVQVANIHVRLNAYRPVSGSASWQLFATVRKEDTGAVTVVTNDSIPAGCASTITNIGSDVYLTIVGEAAQTNTFQYSWDAQISNF
jgi:hypothetical protein